MKPSVLMTDPRHFAIRGGANPHTRNDDDSLKVVDPSTAFSQWNRYVDQLLDHGVSVYVVDSGPELTGMVFAANAGFIDSQSSGTDRTFYPSRFTASHRKSESPAFAKFMGDFGFKIGDIPGEMKFEGEADAYPIGDAKSPHWLFTYGFRSEFEIAEWLERKTGNAFLTLQLQDPRFYHGDCLVCSLGGEILAWEPGIELGSREKLSALTDVIWLTDDDASDFVGNSFYVEVGSDRLLFSPVAIRQNLIDEIGELGVTVVRVDISEFFTKGGGGPKCMVFNLGLVSREGEFRESRSIATWRKSLT